MSVAIKKRLFTSSVLLLALLLTCPISADLSEASNLEYVSSILWTKAYDAKIDGDHAYCAFLNGLVILDISNKLKPVFISRLFLGGGFGIDLKHNFAFIAAGKKGLKIVDISNVNAPSLIGFFDTQGEAKEIAVKGDHAYVADGSSGLQIIDISEPSAPSIVGSLEMSGFANGITIKGNYAYVSDEISGLKKIDISHPSSPRLVSSFDTPGESAGALGCGEYIVVPDSFSLLILK